MLMNSPPADPSLDPAQIPDLLARMVSRKPDEVCEVALALWSQLSKSLEAIIGREGFEALYDRSLHLAGAAFPWLTAPQLAPGKHPRFDRLKLVLQSRSPDETEKATVILLSTFIEVLSTLIGRNLTLNILRAAWGDAFEAAALEISTWPKK